MKLNNDLLPCPFCGSRNVGIVAISHDHNINFHSLSVECANCEIMNSSFFNAQEAADAWNKRANTGEVK